MQRNKTLATQSETLCYYKTYVQRYFKRRVPTWLGKPAQRLFGHIGRANRVIPRKPKSARQRMRDMRARKRTLKLKTAAIADALTQNPDVPTDGNTQQNSPRCMDPSGTEPSSSETASPFQTFLTGEASCRVTFVLRLLLEVYNQHSTANGNCNANLICAGRDAANDGTGTRTAVKISLLKILPLSAEVIQQCRAQFKSAEVVVIGEVSIISGELLSHVDVRLKQLTGNYTANFGGLDVVLIGDVPSARASTIHKQLQRSLGESAAWRELKFYELNLVVMQLNQLFSKILKKIDSELLLDEDELQLIESRFFRKDQAAQLCPHGIRLFLSNKSVNEYNSSILSSADDKVLSVASDIVVGCRNAEQEAYFCEKLRQMSTTDTGGLPYEVPLVLNKWYMLTTNVDASDGLTKGVLGRLVHIEFGDNGGVTRVWLNFLNSWTVGTKTRREVSVYARERKISRRAVPVDRKTSTVYMDVDKSLVATRTNLPLTLCSAISIDQSQKEKFDDIVYEYEKFHSLRLLYMALSRVRKVNGLYIVTPQGDNKLYHGRRPSISTESLPGDLGTVGRQLVDFMTAKKETSVSNLNLKNQISQKSMVLIISENLMASTEHTDVSNFDCVVKFGEDGMDINSTDTTATVTPHLAISLKQTTPVLVDVSEVGEICCARCRLEDGQVVVIVAVYISPNKRISDITNFIHEVLQLYTPLGVAKLDENWADLPMIMGGDFNLSFAEPEAQQIVDFLADNFMLKMSNDGKRSTTFDAVFCRFLEKIRSQPFVSYFGYHKPVVAPFEFIDCMNTFE